MRFSVWPIVQQPMEDFLATCRHAEAAGYDGVWVSDHLMPSREPLDTPVLECFTTAAAVAATVPRVRIGTLVASNTFRHPALVAKMAASIAALCGDRFILGLGAGWQQNEHDAHGIPLGPPKARLAALDEACRVVRALSSDARVDHRGEHYQLEGAVHRPQPARLPLLVGVKGDRALRVAARHADEWNIWADPEALAARAAVLDRHCEEVGRDPATIERSAQALVLFSDGPAPADLERWQRSGLPMVSGTPDDMRATIDAYARAGCDELVIPDFTFDGPSATRAALDRMMEQVIAPWRGATSDP